jgi:PTH1 family peptidyl-tRNA hydrolase
MLPKRVHLVAGLGNPGDTYKKTRHNTGFMVLDEVAKAFSISVDKRKFDVVFGRGVIENIDVILAKPQAFMNRSGPSLRRLAGYFKIFSKDMLIVHDDIDLTLGRIKIKEKGGHGGHKGLKSLIDAFGNGDFARIRLGVGRSEALSVTDHVLGRFGLEEKEILDQTIIRAREAVDLFFIDGIEACMNRFNKKID